VERAGCGKPPRLGAVQKKETGKRARDGRPLKVELTEEEQLRKAGAGERKREHLSLDQ
jgi:hypothetical protein